MSQLIIMLSFLSSFEMRIKLVSVIKVIALLGYC